MKVKSHLRGHNADSPISYIKLKGLDYKILVELKYYKFRYDSQRIILKV